MATFDFVSFAIGLIAGMIILLIVLWVSYFTRSFLFTNCPSDTRSCGVSDLFSDPGDTLAHNPQLGASDILFLNGNNELFHNRAQRVSTCVPQDNQTVYMKFPQYCNFSDTESTGDTWKQTGFNSNIYKPIGFVGPTITTTGNCNPIDDSPLSNGIPLVKWDPNAISS